MDKNKERRISGLTIEILRRGGGGGEGAKNNFKAIRDKSDIYYFAARHSVPLNSIISHVSRVVGK